MSTTAIPKNCACERIHPGCTDEWVDQSLCPLHGEGAGCTECGAPLGMTQDEVGYMEDEDGTTDYDMPLGLPCEDCGRRMDDDAREAEHQADLLDELHQVW